MERLRTVAVYYNYKKDDIEYIGYFHGFSTESNPDGSTPMAIIEDEKGNINCPHPVLIQFLNPEPMMDCTFFRDNSKFGTEDNIFCHDKNFINFH